MKKFFKKPVCMMILILGILSCTACSDKTEELPKVEKENKTETRQTVSENDEAVAVDTEAEEKEDMEEKAEEEITEEAITEETAEDVSDEKITEEKGNDYEQEEYNSEKKESDSEQKEKTDSNAVSEPSEEITDGSSRYDSGELGVYMSKNEGWISALLQKMFSSATGGYTCSCSFSAKGGVLTVSCTVGEVDNLTDKEKEEVQEMYNSKKSQMASMFAMAKKEVPSLESVVLCVYDKDGDLLISDTVKGK